MKSEIEIETIDGQEFLVLERPPELCCDCYFLDWNCGDVSCSDSDREDGRNVQFLEVEPDES